MKTILQNREADNFLKVMRKGKRSIPFLRLTAFTDVGEIIGSGSISSDGDKYLIEWYVPDGELAQKILRDLEKGGPRIYTPEHRWEMDGETSEGLVLSFKVFPPRLGSRSSLKVIRLDLETSRLLVTRKKSTLEDEAEFAARVRSFGFSLAESKATESSSKDSVYHAAFLGVKSPLRTQRKTTIEIANDFLGGAGSSWKSDTWMLVRDHMTFALIQRKNRLHAYLSFESCDLSEDEQESRFTAFLEAVAFTHGCRPWPLFRELIQDCRTVECVIFTPDRVLQTSAAPLDDRTIAFHPEAESMMVSALDFYSKGSDLVRQFNRLRSILCEAHEGRVIREADILALCTVFEGVIKCLFDHYELRDRTQNSSGASQFKEASLAVREWLNQKHVKLANTKDSPWFRLIGFIKSCGYIRTDERANAVADFYGIPWEGDMELVLEMWKSQRHPLAHGARRDDDPAATKEMFRAWSRITGAINRLMLAEMGYLGWFRYSAMEAGLHEMNLKPAPPRHGVANDNA